MTSQFQTHHPSAVISVPGSTSSEAKRAVPCTFRGLEGRRLYAEANERIPVSTPISVEYDDALFLGEVLACRPEGKSFELIVEVEQVLAGLSSLMVLRSRLLGEERPATVTPMQLTEVYS